MDTLALGHAVAVLSLELLRQRTARDSEYSIAGELLQDVLTAGITEQSLHCAAAMGIDLEHASAIGCGYDESAHAQRPATAASPRSPTHAEAHAYAASSIQHMTVPPWASPPQLTTPGGTRSRGAVRGASVAAVYSSASMSSLIR